MKDDMTEPVDPSQGSKFHGFDYEFDCPVCDDGKMHKARILKKVEGEDRLIMEVECQDCKRRGIIKVFKTTGVEIYDF